MLAYAYVLVRTDLLLAQQIVQVGHACVEAGRRFEWPAEPCNLVVLAVPSLGDLECAVHRIELEGVPTVVFRENDRGLEPTAACTAPVPRSLRRVFRRFSLWHEG
jgi:hypothetical protein